MNQKTDGHGEESPASAAKTAKGKKGRKGRKFLYAVVQGSTGVLREYCIPTEASRSQHWYVVRRREAEPLSCCGERRERQRLSHHSGHWGQSSKQKAVQDRQGAKGWVFTLDSSFAHKPIVPGSGKCGGLGVRVEGESWRASSARAKDR